MIKSCINGSWVLFWLGGMRGGEYLGRLSEAQLEWGEYGGHVPCVHEVEMDVQ